MIVDAVHKATDIVWHDGLDVLDGVCEQGVIVGTELQDLHQIYRGENGGDQRHVGQVHLVHASNAHNTINAATRAALRHSARRSNGGHLPGQIRPHSV